MVSALGHVLRIMAGAIRARLAPDRTAGTATDNQYATVPAARPGTKRITDPTHHDPQDTP
ncbi:hypothetical protein [Alloactinosynnema sp. L-07]|uniref:hypothetical protein n=1 Tax=Alloactinosynnema sp. L-07 TaxID=1653480 RepID=UPI0012FCBF0D|nr:hypothetical protein [Alloactinosynnema sp. L-07]